MNRQGVDEIKVQSNIYNKTNCLESLSGAYNANA